MGQTNYSPIAIVVLLILSSCAEVPLTGRRQVTLLPESQLIEMGFNGYREFMSEHSPSADRAMAARVETIGRNIAGAVEDYFRLNNIESRLEGYEWEFTLIDDDTPNAWAMPGGKIVVYSGILPYTVDDDGMAVVIGHEIAHVVARHGNERMSQQLMVELGGIALSEAISEKPEETRELFLLAYGAGSHLGGLLPYSRRHEEEADRLGLIFMAMAGYNPEAAIPFWERMSSMGGVEPPEFLSTHPSSRSRMRAMENFIPEAKGYMPER